MTISTSLLRRVLLNIYAIYFRRLKTFKQIIDHGIQYRSIYWIGSQRIPI